MSGAHPLLAAEAENAVRQWRYQPSRLNGEPVEIVTTLEVDFRLGQ
jgi:protein TonB